MYVLTKQDILSLTYQLAAKNKVDRTIIYKKGIPIKDAKKLKEKKLVKEKQSIKNKNIKK